MDRKASEADVAALASILGSVALENQIALRRGGRIFVPRLTRFSARTLRKDAAVGEVRIPLRSENEGYFLDVGARHTLEDLVFKPRPRKAPGPSEVEMRVHAAGLNFRDVLNALGQYPGQAGLLGFECAGTILSAGSEANGWRSGDAVIAMASPGCLASHLTVDRAFVFPKPHRLTFEEAVTIPGAFLTAYYALHVLGNIQPGDRVLIHAAAGGVGLAAVQIAQRAGAEVFATAGSSEKREFLASRGVKHIMSSRTLDFAEEIRAITQGAGVTMVLNSLTGDFIPKSLSVLARHGRFLEMGKIAIWDEARVHALDATLAYHPFDLAAVAREKPGLIGGMFRTLLADFEAGALHPLPATVFPLSEAEEAFRFMAQAKHIGKIVLSRGAELRQEVRQRDGIVRSEATYLVTGGLGALGLLLAKWLVAEGARHLILVGRNEPKGEGLKLIQELRNGGADVQTFRADVSDLGDISRLMAHIRNLPPPLKGVIHAAGVLDDAMLADLTGERFRAVMAPKGRGAWNLHVATQPDTLDFFVMFSSIAAIIGNLGQANYAAANACLDGLAAQRRKLGQPGTSINWGPWAESGMAAALSSERFSAQGIRFLNLEQGLRLVRQILQQDLGHPCAVDIDWSAYADRHGLAPSAGLFAELISAGRKPVAAAAEKGEEKDLVEQLGAVLPMEREGLLVAFLQDLAREVLGYSHSEVIAPDQALGDQGFDSLMTVDMRNRLSKILDCSLPASLLFDHPTLEQMADYLLRDVIKLEVVGEARLKAAGESRPSVESVLREIDDLVGRSP